MSQSKREKVNEQEGISRRLIIIMLTGKPYKTKQNSRKNT